ncbi:MAG: NADH-quinone oxidoreductase subunit N [Armatimonadetes bacterium]|nr:NADH-quinone oxidoreductase subunit N [Armatimonadota bacterium]
MDPTIPQIDWSTVMPVVIVVLTGVAALFVEMFSPRRNNNAIVGVSLAGLAIAGGYVVKQFGMADGPTFGGFILRDQLGLVLQLLLIGVCFVAFLFSEGYLREKRIAFAEFYPLALWSTSGAMLMVTTTNMLELFLGLEVLSIALYCLAGMSRQESKSEESALKYFLLGAFASAFFLMGIAYLYGSSGSLDLAGIGTAIASGKSGLQPMAVFGLGMLLVGIAFKAAFVPFHQWTPDVYQGAPTNVTGFMAAASKIAAFGALIRVLDAAVPIQANWFPAMYWICILTMTVGNLAAVVQKDVKRVLGYSSIANAGYVLVAVLAHIKAPDKVGLGTAVYFLLAYALMTLGSFAVVSLAAKGGKEGTRFSDMHGLWKRAPFAVTCLIVFLASLIGVPFTGGFVGKLLIFSDALAAGMPLLAIVLAVNSVISVYYYLGIMQATFVDDEGAVKTSHAKPGLGLNIALLACVVGVFWVAIGADGVRATLGLSAGPKPVSAQTESTTLVARGQAE